MHRIQKVIGRFAQLLKAATSKSARRSVDEAETCWRVCGTEGLSWCRWDGDCLVYHPLSGDTQFLDVAAAEVLKAVADASPARHELCEMLAGFLEVDNDSKLDEAVSRILERLDDLGIIEPVPR